MGTKLQGFEGNQPHPLLEQFTLYGLVMKETENALQVTCLPCPHMMAVLRSFAAYGHVEKPAGADWRRLFGAEDKAYGYDDIVRIAEPQHQKLLTDIARFFEERGGKVRVKYAGTFGTALFFAGKGSKEKLRVSVDRDQSVRIKVRLEELSKYEEKLDTCTPALKQMLTAGRECVDCGYCKNGPVPFALQGKAYRKCSIICVGFCFLPVQGEDASSFYSGNECGGGYAKIPALRGKYGDIWFFLYRPFLPVAAFFAKPVMG